MNVMKNDFYLKITKEDFDAEKDKSIYPDIFLIERVLRKGDNECPEIKATYLAVKRKVKEAYIENNKFEGNMIIDGETGECLIFINNNWIVME